MVDLAGLEARVQEKMRGRYWVLSSILKSEGSSSDPAPSTTVSERLTIVTRYETVDDSPTSNELASETPVPKMDQFISAFYEVVSQRNVESLLKKTLGLCRKKGETTLRLDGAVSVAHLSLVDGNGVDWAFYFGIETPPREPAPVVGAAPAAAGALLPVSVTDAASPHVVVVSPPPSAPPPPVAPADPAAGV